MIQSKGDLLCCPKCDSTYVHLDEALVGARAREDGPVSAVRVDSQGRIAQGPEVDLPVQPRRRHAMSLAGWCEECGGQFAISFEQHKGNTIISVLTRRWVGSDDDGS